MKTYNDTFIYTSGSIITLTDFHFVVKYRSLSIAVMMMAKATTAFLLKRLNIPFDVVSLTSSVVVRSMSETFHFLLILLVDMSFVVIFVVVVVVVVGVNIWSASSF